MKPATTDQELEFELQELYLTGKRWMSDMTFMNEKLIFLKEQLTKNPLHLPALQLPEGAEVFIDRLDRAEINQGTLATEVVNFMNKLEPLIVDKAPVIGMSLIEDYCLLDKKNKKALDELEDLKKGYLLG
ncbi:hypothetical protein [Mucilaginibacter aquariorum]|uniref:Uncharacterized protein n=1 Tax=Mucilaginibacter aquariorum TaxID=2967225 RepID=A0ABT1T3K5_9SPHI|nr:hypothetical protein [Mucilaginibacter aquariorum]MCQ6959191.1 hypothetical protein [Mucilaginibacter aquariorum]